MTAETRLLTRRIFLRKIIETGGMGKKIQETSNYLEDNNVTFTSLAQECVGKMR